MIELLARFVAGFFAIGLIAWFCYVVALFVRAVWAAMMHPRYRRRMEAARRRGDDQALSYYAAKIVGLGDGGRRWLRRYSRP